MAVEADFGEQRLLRRSRIISGVGKVGEVDSFLSPSFLLLAFNFKDTYRWKPASSSVLSCASWSDELSNVVNDCFAVSLLHVRLHLYHPCNFSVLPDLGRSMYFVPKFQVSYVRVRLKSSG